MEARDHGSLASSDDSVEENFGIEENVNKQSPLILGPIGFVPQVDTDHQKQTEVISPFSKKRNRRKRDVYKDNEGTPIFEKGEHKSGTAHVVGEGIYVPISSLSAHARLVAHRYQKSKKQMGLSGPTKYDNDSNKDINDEDNAPTTKKKSTLSDFLPSHLQSQVKTNPSASLISALKNEVEFLINLPPEDPEIPKVVSIISTKQKECLSMIQTEYDEDILNELLSTLDLVNSVLAQYPSNSSK
eukprot:TRINITY_DN4317_c0_g1_i1.p1 TRINITY_DN4317_c0_g1~~TRINITY_DN4317_c0_g1_i1.p1  ORF type:complete len:259 (+),score=55.62 TRINITY_DN4317_c0_g1_i1:49-777(+)